MSEQTVEMGVSMETEDGLAIIDALNEVSDVLSMEGERVTFVSEPPTRLDGPDRLAMVQAFRCPRGLFLFFEEGNGTRWGLAVPRHLL